MSTVFSPVRSRTSGTSTRPSPRLAVVKEAPFRPPRMPFVLFVVALLAGGLVGLLLLNTELQRGTFEVTRLNEQAGQLRDQQEALERQARILESPQHLSTQAQKLGMVPNPNPVFLRVPDGKVFGVPQRARAGADIFGPQLPRPKPKPTVPPKVKPVKPVKPPVARPSTASGR